MDRISGDNWVDIGGGRRGFRARDTNAGVKGTQVAALWMNNLQEELLAIIENTGNEPDAGAQDQIWDVLRAAIQEAGWAYAVAAGTANALTADLSVAPPALTPGLSVLIKVSTTNTGPATLDLNNLGVNEIRRRDGAALAAGQLPADGLVQLTYDGTYWQMVPLATSASAGLPVLPYTVATGGANALVADFDPALTGLSAGLAIEVKVATTNTGAATINVNSLGATAIKRADGAALRQGDLVAGQVALLHYDGAAFQLANPRAPRNELIYVADTGPANWILVAPDPPISAYVEGQMFMVKVAATNTGPGTINVNGLGTKEIWHRFGAQVVAGELIAGEMALLVYDGTRFQHLNGGRKRPGTPDFWTASTPPPGALERNGAVISRTAYAPLFAVIGTTFGAGDGVSTFNIPDDRGLFMRGWDNGRGYDSGRAFGSEQDDELKSHTHPVWPRVTSGLTAGSNYLGTMGLNKTDATDATGGSETRPKNRAQLPIIWF